METVFKYEIYIKTSPEQLWQAITDPALRRKYSFGVGVFSDWTPGSSYDPLRSHDPARDGRAPHDARLVALPRIAEDDVTPGCRSSSGMEPPAIRRAARLASYRFSA